MVGGDIGEVQVNPVGGHAERFLQQNGDLLRESSVHLTVQTADAADVHKRGIARFPGHEDGRRADDDHDILFWFADRPANDFGQCCEQGALLFI